MTAISIARRGLVALALMTVAGFAQAATPASGTLTDTSGPLGYTSGPFMVPNATGAAALTCMNPVAPCDTFALTVTLPAGFAAAHPKAVFTVSTAWANTTEDYDIYLNDSTGTQVNSSASSSDPEMYTQGVTTDSVTYSLVIVPATPLGGTTTTTITLVPGAVETSGSTTPTGPVLNQPQPTGLPPRFKVDFSPPASANTSGEPSIGYSFKSKNGMFISDLQQLRLVFPWNQTNPVPDTDPKGVGANLPESCDANWVDATSTLDSLESLDPILHTDSVSGRTFVSQLSGANSILTYTDDDGLTYLPGQIGPPNGGPDHQTIGTGPYPTTGAGAVFGAAAAAAGIKYATYYCSQGIVDAFCSRSDDGGITFGQGSPQRLPTDCGTVGALHGHVKVGPDGAVYVAPKSCGSTQAVFVSTDAATTFTTKTLPNTTADTEVDPSVAIGVDYNTDGSIKKQRLYDCFISADGHPHAQVTLDGGTTWTNDYDLGDSVGVVNSTFPTINAGDADRAACAFAGTTTPGNHDSAGFTGVWYNFLAVTYDGGKSWFTVNLTPNDPVQGTGGLCNGGTLCGNNRNLLDFTEMTLDEKGRVLFGYADGCIGTCLQDPAGNNSFADKGAVGRQIGGRSLLSKYDVVEPVSPNSACLAGDRSSQRSHLSWNPPDTGGAAVSNYSIYRSASASGPFTAVGSSGTKPTFDDTTDNKTDPLYYKVTATNAKGEGLYSNIVKLPIGPDPVIETSCSLPGITVFVDAAGDSTGGIAQTDVLALHGAELPATPNLIEFTMQISSLNPLLPGVYYIILSKDTAGNDIYLQADTTTNPGGMAFTYGTYTAGTAGVLLFTQAGTLDASSTYDPTAGNIFFVADRSIFGNPAIGKSILADVRIRQGANAATSRDTGGPAAYTVNGTDICAILAKPLAAIAADVLSGTAPLTVNFDASGSTTANPNATINTYTFDFGDNTAKVGPQASPKASHVYQTAGSYSATVVVTDSANQTSTNTASKFITVKAAGASGSTTGSTTGGILPGSPAAGSPDNGRLGGGSLGGLDLAALALLLGARRRRR
jgi:PKD repeat protein